VNRVSAFWSASLVQAAGFAIAITATICAFLSGPWWIGLAILLAAPFVAATLVMTALPRP
jgi:hypothetical protein